ncbi:hypothetical protein GGF31_006748 [Allomyces arbusculus]|nr:hypothetical protein GGF31_006748 [Allomyces arbusculus]
MTSLWATVTADARVGMLLYCSLSIFVDSINCLAQTFTTAYPFVAMWPGLYQVRLGAFIPIGGIINLVIVRRVSMLAFSSPERRTWLWRGMLLVFAVEFPANIIVLLQEIYRTNANNAWSTFRIGPILVIINTLYPLSSFLASAYMLHHAFGRRAAHALAATTAATAGASGTLKPVPTSPSQLPPTPIRSASVSELPPSPASSRDAEDTVEPTAEPSGPSNRSTPTSRASAPAETATTTPARHTTSTAGAGGPRASAATEVQESIGASFRLLHISIVVIWSTYLVIHGFAITSPFVRSALSNVLVVFVLALEAALKYLVRGAHRRARRRKGVVVPRHATAVAYFDDASQLETKAELASAPGARSMPLVCAKSVNVLAVMRSSQMLAGMRSVQALAVAPPSAHGRGSAEHDGGVESASPPHMMDTPRRSPPSSVAVLVLSGSLPRPVGVRSGGGEGVGNAATASRFTLASHISDLG